VSEPVIDVLEEAWGQLEALGEQLDETQWKLPTDCPGWSVQDNLAHITGTELALLGEPGPPEPDKEFPYVKNVVGQLNEPWIESMRSMPGKEVLDRFRDATRRRLEVLRAMDADEWDELGWTPAGEGPYREFMNIRALDSWVHLQDMRRALGLPGDQSGLVADHALGRMKMAMGYVVGKKAAAPDGSTIVFEVTGPTTDTFAVGVDGRAALLDDPPDDPAVTLRMDFETYAVLGCGRRDPAEALSAGEVEISGDRELGESVVRNLNFMI